MHAHKFTKIYEINKFLLNFIQGIPSSKGEFLLFITFFVREKQTEKQKTLTDEMISFLFHSFPKKNRSLISLKKNENGKIKREQKKSYYGKELAKKGKEEGEGGKGMKWHYLSKQTFMVLSVLLLAAAEKFLLRVFCLKPQTDVACLIKTEINERMRNV